MKNKLYAIILITLCNFYSYSNQKDSVKLSDDAIVLTLQLQEKGIYLDSALAIEIDQALTKARILKDTLNSIHVRRPIEGTKSLLLYVSSKADWTAQWKNGILFTGNTFIDSLSEVFFLDTVIAHYLLQSYTYELLFKIPLQIDNLAMLYIKEPSVTSTGRNYSTLDGDDIEIFKKDKCWNLAFSLGGGDCPSGCTYRYYWYVSVCDSIATPVNESEIDYSKAIIYTWNKPSRYDPTYFSSFESIIDNAWNAKNWWVRQYAIEAIGKLFTQNDSPDRNELFQQLKQDAIENRNECKLHLMNLMEDPDPDIYNSAILSLGTILGNGRNYSAYYPLQLGNRWVWSKSFNSDSIERIIDTTFKYDEFLYRFNRLREIDTPYVRIDGYSWMRMYVFSCNIPWLNFNPYLGNIHEVKFCSSSSIPSWKVQQGSVDDTVKIGDRIFLHCRRYDALSCCDWGWTEWFAPGIGPVKREEVTLHGIETYYLVSAIIDNTEISTSISESDNAIPIRFLLMQNYPNPFNPLTTIKYQLPQSSFVTLKVFDILGKEVAEIVNEKKDAGTYSVPFNASGLASGIYFYELKAGHYSSVRKMSYIK